MPEQRYISRIGSAVSVHIAVVFIPRLRNKLFKRNKVADIPLAVEIYVPCAAEALQRRYFISAYRLYKSNSAVIQKCPEISVSGRNLNRRKIQAVAGIYIGSVSILPLSQRYAVFMLFNAVFLIGSGNIALRLARTELIYRINRAGIILKFAVRRFTENIRELFRKAKVIVIKIAGRCLIVDIQFPVSRIALYQCELMAFLRRNTVKIKRRARNYPIALAVINACFAVEREVC